MDKFDTSENKVIYLLGAGASAKALPTVKSTDTTRGMSNALRDFAENLKFNESINAGYKNFIDELVKDLKWIADNSNKFGTPDTFAKFLYLQERSSLNRLKNALSFYFTFEQLFNQRIDNRALIFLTTVMQRGNIFPTNIKILNWNYDCQIQLAAESFQKEDFHYTGNLTKHSPPLVGYYPKIGNHLASNFRENEVSMVHLNGIAGYYFYEQTAHFLSHMVNMQKRDINDFIDRIITDSQHKHNLLTFAWEKSTEASNLMNVRVEYAKKMIQNSNTLVVIGYSFPVFNREIDKEIFETLKESTNFNKIYYQDPYRDGDFLRSQFDLPKTIEIVNIKETDNFHVPLEI